MAAMKLDDAVITGHAREQIARRGLTEAQVRRAPEQVATARPGRLVVQKRLSFSEEKREYLVRVFVDIDRRPAEIVTAYRTSRMDRYLRPS